MGELVRSKKVAGQEAILHGCVLFGMVIMGNPMHVESYVVAGRSLSHTADL